MSARHNLRLDWLRGNVRDLRIKYELACRAPPQRPHEWRVIEADGRQIRVLIHHEAAKNRRAIFYFHGGGWIVGSPATHADISGALAAATGLPVISVDYRLAPEFKAAAAIADGLGVLGHFLKSEFTSAILCGDSAGGSLALAVERHAAHLKPGIRGVASLYGSFGLMANAALHRDGKARDGLDAASVRRYWRAANASSGTSAYSIAALARTEGCPIHLVIAGRDPLRDDSIALARALHAKGRPVTVDLHPFEGHSFLQNPKARRARENAFRNIAAWIDGLRRRQ